MNNLIAKVSVVIPCYNQGTYIQDALDSLFEQSYHNFEIIVVNDGSTDEETIQFLNDYSSPKVKIIHTTNQGASAARNQAIQAATGKYILPLDADDKIGSTYLEKAVAILEENENIGIVYCEAEFFGARSGKWELPEYNFPKILVGNMIFSTAMFRKSDWEKVEGYPTGMKFWEDFDFWLSLIELGREVIRIPEVLFFYRKHPGSRTDSMSFEDTVVSYSQLYKNHARLYFENIEAVFAHIVELRTDFQQSQSQLTQVHSELVKVHSQLLEAHSNLAEAHSNLAETHSQLNQAHIELDRSENQRLQAEGVIAAMESSKFWKLRQAWLKIKGALLGRNQSSLP